MATQGVSDVHYYNSTMSGAPTLSANAGTLIAVLDACLINGFGSQVAQGCWEKAFSGTNKAAYRSTDATARQPQRYLRVNDTNTISGVGTARVVGYETMTDVDTGTGVFPTSAQLSNGGVCYKSVDTSGTARAWSLFADNRAFYLFIKNHSSTYYGGLFFGEILPYSGSDNYSCAILCSDSSPSYFALSALAQSGVSVNAKYLARDYTQTGTSKQFSLYADDSYWTGGAGAGNFKYPHLDGRFHAKPIECVENDGSRNRYRGRLPGVLNPAHRYAEYSLLGTLTNVYGYDDRSFSVQEPGSQNARILVDMTGPWRDDGNLGVSGKVTEVSVPGAYQVRLFRQSDMQLIASTWSDANGDYAFTGLRDQKHVLVAIDHTNPLRSPAIQDNVIPS